MKFSTEKAPKKFTWDDGIYDWECIDAKEGLSKSSGEPMITLTIRLHDGDKTKELNDYLPAKLGWKIEQFCDSAGITDKFEAGNLSYSDCIKTFGKCEIVTEQYEYHQTPGSMTTGTKNKIKKYLARTVTKTIDEALGDDELLY